MTSGAPPAADALTRFVFEHAAVRGAHVALADTTRAVLACHPYPPALARAFHEELRSRIASLPALPPWPAGRLPQQSGLFGGN